jgi:hypothetical protein
MTNKEQMIKEIVDDVFNVETPPDSSRRDQITDFVTTAVNGDEPRTHLALNAMLSANITGVILYILTNYRLIKIDIGANDLLSNSFHLTALIGAERKFINPDLIQFSLSFPNGSFGLKYSPTDKKITDFFQLVDQASTEASRSLRGLPHG